MGKVGGGGGGGESPPLPPPPPPRFLCIGMTLPWGGGGGELLHIGVEGGTSAYWDGGGNFYILGWRGELLHIGVEGGTSAYWGGRGELLHIGGEGGHEPLVSPWFLHMWTKLFWLMISSKSCMLYVQVKGHPHKN